MLLAAVFKPHESFKVTNADIKRQRDIAEKVERESPEVPKNFKYEPPEYDIPVPDMGLDPDKR